MTFKDEVDKAQDEFKKTVGASFVLLSSNSEYSESRIIMGLIYTLLETIEEIQDYEPTSPIYPSVEDEKK